MKLWRNVGLTLEMIKWEHCVFALPFALTARSLVGFRVASCMATFLDCRLDGARGFRRNRFNRCADAELDARNPRTKTRAIPAGQLSKGFVGGFVLIASLLFLVAASRLNRLTLLLEPFELALIFLYSYTKRFTRWSHLVLGLVLGSAPSAAWIAIRGALDPRILVLTALVLCWVAGFDTPARMLNMTVKMG